MKSENVMDIIFRTIIHHYNNIYEIRTKTQIDEVLQNLYREMIKSHTIELPKNSVECKLNRSPGFLPQIFTHEKLNNVPTRVTEPWSYI